MQADQRETGQIVIEIDLLPPAAFVMTGLATGAQLPVVRIVLFVTGGARRRQLVAIKVALVAGIALGLPMLAAKSKLGLLVMIEKDHIPFLRAVAGVALRAIAPAMHILQLMADAANRTDALIAFAGMTRIAVNFLMRPGQLEFGLGMIEGFDGTPGLLAVAGCAFFT